MTDYAPIVERDQVPFVRENKLRTRIEAIAEILERAYWRDEQTADNDAAEVRGAA